MKATFIRFMSASHLNGQNVALYSGADGAELRAENVATGGAFAARRFPDLDAAEYWYCNIPGTGLGRLQSAIEHMRDDE